LIWKKEERKAKVGPDPAFFMAEYAVAQMAAMKDISVGGWEGPLFVFHAMMKDISEGGRGVPFVFHNLGKEHFCGRAGSFCLSCL
jgi:hypothetical protein